MSLFESYDAVTPAILNPEDVYKPVEGFPETVLVTFGKKYIDMALEQYDCEICAYLFAGEKLPIYSFEYGGKKLGLLKTYMAAPITVSLMEEAIVLGAKKFVFFGSCGTLDAAIPASYLIVPTEAYRDEGTSYHYMPASAGEYVKVPTADETAAILEDLGIPHVKTRVWTTDGLYRETRGNMKKRADEGCGAVDMECSAIMAAAEFRGVKAWQFFYATDNLDAVEWEPRMMGKMPNSLAEVHLRAAVEIGCRVSEDQQLSGKIHWK